MDDEFQALDVSLEVSQFREDMIKELELLREWANRLTQSQRLLIEAQHAMINALQAEFKNMNQKLDNLKENK